MILKVNIECQLSIPRHLEISTLNSSSRTAVKAANRPLVTFRCTQDLSAAPTVIRLLPQDVILPGCHPERSDKQKVTNPTWNLNVTYLLPRLSSSPTVILSEAKDLARWVHRTWMSPICCPGCHLSAAPAVILSA